MYKNGDILRCIKTHPFLSLEKDNEYSVTYVYCSKNQRRSVKIINLTVHDIKEARRWARTIEMRSTWKEISKYLVNYKIMRTLKIKELNDKNSLK